MIRRKNFIVALLAIALISCIYLGASAFGAGMAVKLDLPTSSDSKALKSKMTPQEFLLALTEVRSDDGASIILRQPVNVATNKTYENLRELAKEVFEEGSVEVVIKITSEDSGAIMYVGVDGEIVAKIEDAHSITIERDDS